MSPISRPPARRLTANCMSTWTRLTSWLVFPFAAVGRARLIGTMIKTHSAVDWEALKFEDVSRRAIDHLKVQDRQGELVLD